MCPARDLETVQADPVEVGPDNELDKLVYIYIYLLPLYPNLTF